MVGDLYLFGSNNNQRERERELLLVLEFLELVYAIMSGV